MAKSANPLLVFGGTFNPIHLGHVAMAEQILDFFGAERMLLVPSARPPHREQPNVSAEQRADMVNLATSHDARMTLDDREILRNGASYTVLTLQELRDDVGDQRAIIFCLGSDAFDGITRWYQWERLFELANVCIVARPDQVVHFTRDAERAFESRSIDDPQKLGTQPHGLVSVLNCDPMDVSSTQIRDRIRQGESCELLLNESVYEYIREHGLYR